MKVEGSAGNDRRHRFLRQQLKHGWKTGITVTEARLTAVRLSQHWKELKVDGAAAELKDFILENSEHLTKEIHVDVRR